MIAELCLGLWLALAGPDSSEGGAGAPELVRELVLAGNRRTRRATFEALLPRPLPAALDAAEVAELERRIRNLGIFDEVSVARRGALLEVQVREKWTLIPSFSFSSGQEAIDTSVSVGLTESNLFGTGHSLTALAGFADRGPFATLELDQHLYAPRAWAHSADVGYESAELRLGEAEADGNGVGDGGGNGGPASASGDAGVQVWQRHRLGAGYFAAPGGAYQSPLRFGAGPFLVHEWLRRKQGAAVSAGGASEDPAGSSWVGLGVALWIDGMSFDDLTPSGSSILLELTPALRLQRDGDGPGRRAEGLLELGAAAAFARRFGLLARAVAEAVNAGDPNHSLLLGSQRGVRGLPDGRHWNRAQSFTNLEARTSLRFARRWALQLVLFADAAAFQPFDDQGTPQPIRAAWSTGAGARLIPTWLDTLLLRLDAARLWHPTPSWFLQLGTAQYF